MPGLCYPRSQALPKGTLGNSQKTSVQRAAGAEGSCKGQERIQHFSCQTRGGSAWEQTPGSLQIQTSGERRGEVSRVPTSPFSCVPDAEFRELKLLRLEMEAHLCPSPALGGTGTSSLFPRAPTESCLTKGCPQAHGAGTRGCRAEPVPGGLFHSGDTHLVSPLWDCFIKAAAFLPTSVCPLAGLVG